MITNNPRQILFLAVGVSVVCLTLFVWMFVATRSAPPPPKVVNVSPTATLVPLIAPSEYIAKNDIPAYLGSIPKEADKNVNLFESFFVDFDRNIEKESFKIFLTPTSPFQAIKNGATLELKPTAHWRPDYNYRISIIENYSNREVVNIHFQTMKDTYSPPGDTAPLPRYIIEEKENTKKTSPEIYLMNILPYENEMISVSGDYDENAKNFTFLVKSKNNDINEAKIEMQKFLGELEMSADLVKKLKIIYQ